MKIHVLVENTSNCAGLVPEHGLSLLIEACGRRILFDMGASEAFAANAERMGLDLGTVDVAVLSHGHYDHGGGLLHFLELNTHATVWVSPHAFEPHFNANGKNIGLQPELSGHPRLRQVTTGEVNLAPGITLHGAADMPTPYPAEGSGMTAIVGGKRLADDFRHEQYLLIEEAGQRVLFSGCSHLGILNIATHFHPDALVGGFHYMKALPHIDTPRLQQAAAILKDQPTRYYTGHCTGDVAYGILKPLLGERLQVFHTGQSFEL